MVYRRIGGGLILVGLATLAFVTATRSSVVLPAALLGVGAALVSVSARMPLDARLTRIGLGLLALGAFSVVVAQVVESSDAEEMAGLAPLLIAIGALAIGGLALGLSLARSSGRVRVVGAVILLGLALVVGGEALGGGLASPPLILQVGFVIAGAGLAAIGVLALGLRPVEPAQL